MSFNEMLQHTSLVFLLCGILGGMVNVGETHFLSREKRQEESVVAQDAGRCEGEPPSIPNGKPLEFARNSGSIVGYECNPKFFINGSSSVRCDSGEWKGQPPTCTYFDVSFVLDSTPFATPDFSCYSDDNYGKIEYLRVLYTDQGERIQDDASKETFLDKCRFNITGYNYSERFGAFECEMSLGYGNMSIVTLTQTSKTSADIIPLNQFPVANIEDTVRFSVQIVQRLHLPVKWKHNGVDLPSWDDKLQVEIPNVQPKDAGIYESFFEGRRDKFNHAFMRLIVRKCKKNYYGENCNQKCPPCYNGGVCHDHFGICVCPAGFTGANCELACNGMTFGANCSYKCHSAMCSFRRFCKPDPYGCSCSPGYKGFSCYESCTSGWYGADCKQPCHCANGRNSCNRFTGACAGGCAEGWTGHSCQIEVSTPQ